MVASAWGSGGLSRLRAEKWKSSRSPTTSNQPQNKAAAPGGFAAGDRQHRSASQGDYRPKIDRV